MDNQKNMLDQDFFIEIDEFDPMSEFTDYVDDEEDAIGDQVPVQQDLGVNPNPVMPAAEDTRPASVRIATLFDEMQPQRRTLYGVLALCEEIKSDDDVIAFIQDCLKKRHSIFSASILCSHLERAGAIQKVFEDGAPYDYVPEPEVVVEDGVEYLKPAECPAVYWVTTEDGAEFLAKKNSVDPIKSMLGAQVEALPLFKTILDMASADGGTTAKALAKLIDRDPVNQKKRIFSSKYVEMLYKAGALDWDGKWVVTDMGKGALKLITDQLDAMAAEQKEAQEVSEAKEEAAAFVNDSAQSEA